MKQAGKTPLLREANFDLLRILCTLSVIIIHVTATFKLALTSADFFGHLHTEHIGFIALFDTLPRFAVPCFFMLSGAFLLDNPQNREYRYFYRKSFKSIGIPILLFSLLYLGYSEARPVVYFLRGEGASHLLPPVLDLLRGAPFYHMWYMYTLIGIYIAIPAVIRLKESLGETAFSKLSWIFLVVAIISGWTSKFSINWSCGRVICSMGYVLIGYELRRNSRKNAVKALFFIIFGICVELIVFAIQYRHSCAGISEADEALSLVHEYNPFVALASLLIFHGFALLPMNSQKCTKLAYNTFPVYLIHAGVWDVLTFLLPSLDARGIDCRILILFGIAAVSLISYVLAFCYEALWKCADKGERITNTLCRLVHLD